jgi:hypothetical protein
LIAAVPALVNCAVPTIWISSQYAAVASQKFTNPGVTGVAPVVTLAVSVTTVPEATEDSGIPSLVTVNVIAVAVFSAKHGVAAPIASSAGARVATHHQDRAIRTPGFFERALRRQDPKELIWKED